jgi:hypothetical protein
MNKSVFQGRRMIKPAESVAAVLPGYRLAFNMPGEPHFSCQALGATHI